MACLKSDTAKLVLFVSICSLSETVLFELSDRTPDEEYSPDLEKRFKIDSPIDLFPNFSVISFDGDSSPNLYFLASISLQDSFHKLQKISYLGLPVYWIIDDIMMSERAGYEG